MTDWSKFDNINAAELDKASEDLGNGDFPEIPDGEYEVSLQSAELTESKKGSPMLKVDFKIVASEFKKQHIFIYQVIYMGDDNDKIRLSVAKQLLRGLKSSQNVIFENMGAFAKLIGKIEDECMKREYLLKKTTKKGFSNYKILKMFDD